MTFFVIRWPSAELLLFTSEPHCRRSDIGMFRRYPVMISSPPLRARTAVRASLQFMMTLTSIRILSATPGTQRSLDRMVAVL